MNLWLTVVRIPIKNLIDMNDYCTTLYSMSHVIGAYCIIILLIKLLVGINMLTFTHEWLSISNDLTIWRTHLSKREKMYFSILIILPVCYIGTCSSVVLLGGLFWCWRFCFAANKRACRTGRGVEAPGAPLHAAARGRVQWLRQPRLRLAGGPVTPPHHNL